MAIIPLEPCPFCGCDDIRFVYDVEMDLPHIECEGCGIEVRYGDCIKSAISIWNDRAIKVVIKEE